MFSIKEPEAQAPEIYRNTPFEHVTTAEVGQVLVMFEASPAPRGWCVRMPDSFAVMQPAVVADPTLGSGTWLSAVLDSFRLEAIEDAADIDEARKALASPQNGTHYSLDEVKKRLGL